MATLTEVVAAVVVHSSAAAFSHFGVTLETPRIEQRAPMTAEARVVARTPRKTTKTEKVENASTCPDSPRAAVVKV